MTRQPNKARIKVTRQRPDRCGRRALAQAIFTLSLCALWACATAPPGTERHAGVGAEVSEPALAAPPSRLGGETTVDVTNKHAFGRSLANLPVAQLRTFAYGNRLFNTTWVTAPASVEDFDGLGPLFNRSSCVGCHVRDGRGRAPEPGEARLTSSLVRISAEGTGPYGGPKPHPVYGGQLQDKATAPHAAEGRVVITYSDHPVRYPDGTERTLRRPTMTVTNFGDGAPEPPLQTSFRVASAVHGLGLLEAVPEEAILAWSDPQDRDSDGISGRPNRVWDRAAGALALGRFGWKAGQPNLTQQSAAAFAGDVGITSSLVPQDDRTTAQRARLPGPDGGSPELRDSDLTGLVFYLRALAVPAARTTGEGVDSGVIARGFHHFQEVGCVGCHRSTLETASDVALPSLAQQTIHPFTDLLLHDMGEGLADDRAEFAANGREWRTPPLWGLGLIEVVNGHTHLLHDGRARDVEEAILWHGGEAQRSRDRFMALPKGEREALMVFLMSL